MKYILFWSRYDKDLDTSAAVWANRKIRLTELGRLALLSHKRLENEVILYTYQRIANELPNNVELINAGELYDALSAYDMLKRGQRMCHVADLIRFLHTGKEGGIIIDLDTIVLRRFPSKGFIGSMPAKQTGGFAPKWGKAHPPLRIINNKWDGKALIDFPVSVSLDMRRYISPIGETIEKMLQGEPIKGFDGWNAICDALEEIPIEILHPFYTCPVPPWRGGNTCYSLESPTRFIGEIKVYGHVLPSVVDILNGSLAVQHFFESSFRGEYRTELGFWETVRGGSLLAREAEYILGKDWRNILNESHHVLE